MTPEDIKNKSARIAIIGLGYVGLPLCISFLQAHFRVIGIDIDDDKVKKLQQGICYTPHPQAKVIDEAVATGHLTSTTSLASIAEADVIILCLPTPLDERLEPDLHFIEDCCHGILPHLKDGTLVVLESTTWPGTTEERVCKILNVDPANPETGSYHIAYSPEREDPGNKHFSTRSIPKIVSGVGDVAHQLCHDLYSQIIKEVIPVSSTRVAEATKLYENIFRSVNIAMANEMKTIFAQMDINIWEVIKAASTKPFGFMPFWPGPGLGGHCIPIDPFYLAWKAKQFGADCRFVELAGEINRSMPRYVITQVMLALNESGKALKKSKILILGMSYKANVGDTRESASLEIMHQLELAGAEVGYEDPHVPVIGRIRNFPQFLGKECVQNPDYSTYDALILATDHDVFNKERILASNTRIIDTRGFFEDESTGSVYRA